MSFITTGLSNNGRTQYFNFQYESTLSKARGLDLVADVMKYCDSDLSLVESWFSGRSLDMSPPIHVSFENSPTAQGASWSGAGPVPLQITIDMGETGMTMGTPTMMARYLLVSEITEMYMRSFSAYLFNPWFATGEGSKGEGLSRFLAAQFLLKEYPGVAAIPGQVAATFNVSNLWLNSARNNHIDDNVDDSLPDDITGCATLFLFFLHDQLGFSIPSIINAGGGRLSNVYQNLTGDSWVNAWGKFRPLVDAHCPNTVTTTALPGGGTTTTVMPQYNPPLDTIFPVSDLSRLTAPSAVSWVVNFSGNNFTVMVDHVAQVDLVISMACDDPTIIRPFTITIKANFSSATSFLPVLLQPAGFTAKNITLTATYAGKSLSQKINVVPPSQLSLPGLDIVARFSPDPCQTFFLEGSSQEFEIKNLNVFSNHAALIFSWTVTGATASVLNASTLTIDNLPAAGNQVTVKVTVRNSINLQASGSFTFQTAAAPTGIAAIQQQLSCRIRGIRNVALSIPPWVPIERAEILQEELATIERQMRQITSGVTHIKALVKDIKEMNEVLQ